MESFSYLTQEFLSQYFLLEMVVGNFLSIHEKQKIYYDLAEVFCLKKNTELDEFFETASSKPFSGITDRSSYDRFCRFIEFAAGNGQNLQLSEYDKMVLSQKRAAADMYGLISENSMILTDESAYSILLMKAMVGNVAAMALLSYLEYNGICMKTDRENAVKRMRLCARWNSLFGNLLGIAFDSEQKKQHFNRLYTILNNENQKQILQNICEHKRETGPFSKDDVARIIEKAFTFERIRREEYDHAFANIVFSKIISTKDKEKLLLNTDNRQLGIFQDIPFDAYRKREVMFDKSKVTFLPESRKGECEKILRNLKIAEMGNSEIYLPLFVIAHEDAVCDMYFDVVTQVLDGSDVVCLDAASLKKEMLSPIRENIIVRSINETKNTRTVFLITNCDELAKDAHDSLKNLLNFTYRKKFTMTGPSVTLDISDAVIILFAKKFRSELSEIAEDCDTVFAERMNSNEQMAVIEKIFEDRKVMFCNPDAIIEKEALEYLCRLDMSRVTGVIDTGMRNLLFEEKNVLTLDVVREAAPEQKKQKIKMGFGISEGEIK